MINYLAGIVVGLLTFGCSFASAQTIPTIPMTGPLTSGTLPPAGRPTMSKSDLQNTFGTKADAQTTQVGAGAVPLYVDAKLKQSCLSLLDFGADPTDTVVADAAVQHLYAAMLAQHKCGYIPAGKYKVTSQTVFELSTVHASGFTLVGDGTQQSILDASLVTTSPNFVVQDTGGVTGAPASAFYVRIKGIGFLGNIAGTVLQIAKPDLSDYINNIDMDVWVGNASTSTSCVAAQINGIAGPNVLEMVANCGGHGDALQLHGPVFAEFHVSAGNADIAVHFTGAFFMFGNTFIAPDFEGVSYAVVIDAAHAAQNTMVGGQFGYSLAGINATAGSNNLFVNPNFAPTGSANNFAGGVGITEINAEGVTTGNAAQQWSLTNAAGTGWQVQEATDGSVTTTNYVASKPMIWNLQSGGNFSFQINGAEVGRLNSTQSKFQGPLNVTGSAIQALNINSNGNVGFQAQVGTDGTATVTNYVAGKSMVTNIQTGGTFQYNINGVLEATFDANGVEGAIGVGTPRVGNFTDAASRTLTVTAMPVVCTGHPTGTFINVAGVVNVCP